METLRKGGANPVRSVLRPGGALLAEKEERWSGEIAETLRIDAAPPRLSRTASPGLLAPAARASGQAGGRS
jgi:hypothetical protein